MLVYVLVVGVAPRIRTGAAAAIAFGICAAIELLQLTGLPAAIVDEIPAARYVLGTTFNAPDLLAYAAGVLVAAGADLLVGGWQRHASTTGVVTPSASGRTPG